MRFPLALLAIAMGSLAASAQAQTTIWNNSANDSSWKNPSNWSAGIPASTSNVVISTQPTDDLIGVDIGGPATIASLTFNASLTASVEILAESVETLQVNGAITNNDNNEQLFSLGVIAGANATYAGGSGGLTFDTLVVGNYSIATTGTITINSNLNFNLSSTGSFGQIGLVTVDGATINISATGYTASWGDTFDLAPAASSNAFTGASIGILPTLNGGLSWDTTKFLSEGKLTVVPEPSTWALVGITVCLLAIFQARLSRVAPARIRIRR